MHVAKLSQLEEDWKGKCEQTLTSAREQHSRELTELTENRDALQDQLTQLQAKVDELAMIKHRHVITDLSH